jgi:hypothetical protein
MARTPFRSHGWEEVAGFTSPFGRGRANGAGECAWIELNADFFLNPVPLPAREGVRG